ncbi:glycosyltransferase [Arenibacterium halophilum]|uniref:UDP-N-acetylglucosamine--N-acetylmuramyl-(Pentapeptide) pyrophosphoryl-undecaprenol N-acetylglucosamine transferase n=1 Tax=Arenibacterium halophilum TaxID=2583821 RepID=A0ABY2WY75_9RHOB|nr:glycosyltransferase [Arenibacterium halophilum]TMV07429.1 UDP-N-acetylglucosamine--N-acetylmuramyl-(pentapeptide) pyrophosphoryl-undecaprenol N-acetylglucosamine transferase [Arenibacterium halophilum]
MRDFPHAPRPIGYFVHHQGRGHAERCASLVNALPTEQEVVIFCARNDIFPAMRDNTSVIKVPSLFERSGQEREGLDAVATPETLHCAPLGWPGIRRAMATMAQWFDTADPSLMICDVSAEIAQLCRICSVPHVKILQHGDRSDPGHRAAYDGAVGLLAPFASQLAQPDWTETMLGKTHFAGGLGLRTEAPSKEDARARLGLDAHQRVALVLSGGGGSGWSSAPFGVAARALPDWTWITVGAMQVDWHGTEGRNLVHKGWIDTVSDHIAAADLVVSSTGNTTCAEVMAVDRPWIVVPEWRYFDEQVEKARALARAGVALHLDHMPSSAGAWRIAVAEAHDRHRPGAQSALINLDAAIEAGSWLQSLIPSSPSLKHKHEGIVA